MIIPAIASPRTNFDAPSIEPKNSDSCAISARRFFAISSPIKPAFKSASIAICLPGIASSVNRAVTSDTRSEPLLITTNCTISKITKMIVPMTISFPPTNCPNVRTTFPGSPLFKIKRVEDTFSEIRKIVVNNSSVGKNDISSTSCTNRQLNRITSATDILKISNMSNRKEGIGTIKNMIAAIR